MRTLATFIAFSLLFVGSSIGQNIPAKDGIPVTVVATATEYVPRSITVSHPGHSYTDCVGRSDYFGTFEGNGGTGTISLSGNSSSSCSTTFTHLVNLHSLLTSG